MFVLQTKRELFFDFLLPRAFKYHAVMDESGIDVMASSSKLIVHRHIQDWHCNKEMKV